MTDRCCTSRYNQNNKQNCFSYKSNTSMQQKDITVAALARIITSLNHIPLFEWVVDVKRHHRVWYVLSSLLSSLESTHFLQPLHYTCFWIVSCEINNCLLVASGRHFVHILFFSQTPSHTTTRTHSTHRRGSCIGRRLCSICWPKNACSGLFANKWKLTHNCTRAKETRI